MQFDEVVQDKKPDGNEIERSDSAHEVEDEAKMGEDKVLREAGSEGEWEKGSSSSLTTYPTLLDEALKRQSTAGGVRSSSLPSSTLRAAVLTASSTVTSVTSSGRKELQLAGEKSAAFDLLDALTRSGALVCLAAQLHVFVAGSHSFAESVMDTVGRDGVDPILRLERAQLLMAGALFGLPSVRLLPANSSQLQRLLLIAPELF